MRENFLQLKSFGLPPRANRWASLGVSLMLIPLFTAIAAPAWAHHMLGGRMPANGFEGLMSGVGHPVIGLDHLAFIVTLGLLSTLFTQGFWMIPGAVGAALLGSSIHLLGWNIPGNESLVAISVILLGGLLIYGQQLNGIAITAIAAVAGLFHGYAYGESIFGAEPTPLLSYLIGFSLIQMAIAVTARLLCQKLLIPANLRWFGWAGIAIGALFFAKSTGL